MYVEPLIRTQTVNILTEDTIAAFADHGKVRPQSIEAALEEAHKILCQDLPAVGIAFVTSPGNSSTKASRNLSSRSMR
jgi:hypothetical protein